MQEGESQGRPPATRKQKAGHRGLRPTGERTVRPDAGQGKDTGRAQEDGQRQHRLWGLTVTETAATADTHFHVCAGVCAFVCTDSFLPITIVSGGCQPWFIWQFLLCTTKFSQTNIYSKSQTRGVIIELGETLTWPGDECQPGWETGTMTLGVLSFMRGMNLSLFF